MQNKNWIYKHIKEHNNISYRYEMNTITLTIYKHDGYQKHPVNRGFILQVSRNTDNVVVRYGTITDTRLIKAKHAIIGMANEYLITKIQNSTADLKELNG
jgi:hypothetical protein